ncbi:MAG: glycosyltransferase family 2 protein [Chloroflexota bacterium]
MTDLAVIVVSYNVRDLLEPCLKSVLASAGVSFDLCVVDNASSDGSADMVAERFAAVRLIRSPVNGGFSYANNLALRALGFEGPRNDEPDGYRHVLLLNPDTQLPPDALARAVAYLDAQPGIGVVGAKLVRQDGSLDLACRRSFPTPAVSCYRMLGLSRLFPHSRRFGRYNLTYLDPDTAADIDAVAGAFMLVRGEAIRDAGLLDEQFFMYGEDLDWALRIKAAGWRVVYYPAVIVLHIKRGSSRRSRLRTTREFNRSMLLFYRKHYARNTFFLLDWLIVAAIYLRGGTAEVVNRIAMLAARPRPDPAR